MSNKTMIKLVIAIVAVVMTVFVVWGVTVNKAPNVPNYAEENMPTKEAMPKVDLADYEEIYLEYVKNNEEYFSRGMMLCDLNDDKIPELFSVAYDEQGNRICYHELTVDGMKKPTDDSVQTYVTTVRLFEPKTFFESPHDFIGVYRHKKTGEKALINVDTLRDEPNIIDIISFDSNRLVQENSESKGLSDVVDHPFEEIDLVMRDYELVDGELYASVLLRGGFGGENGSDVAAALKELIDDFNSSKEKIKYDDAVDGELKCYIRNVSVAKNEIELVPAAEITFDEYTKAVNSGGLYTIGDETLTIVDDQFSDDGGVELTTMAGENYYIDKPSKDYPVSLISEYTCKTPVKVKIGKNLEFEYQRYPFGEVTFEDYVNRYSELRMLNCNIAHIKNGELVSFKVLYHP